MDGGVRIHVHVQPRAARTEYTGLHGNALKIRLAAPPVDGAANEELVRFFAERLGVPRSRIALVAGHSSRRKTLLVKGCTPEAARRRLTDR